MQPTVQDLLKKINYIEAEVEIQKQILVSIPSDQRGDMEKVIRKIAQAKNEIEQLRAEIKTVSPNEYQNILKIEKAADEFKKIAGENKFEHIENMSMLEDCSIRCKNGDEFSCLVKGRDKDGNWTVITTAGDLRQFQKDDVI